MKQSSVALSTMSREDINEARLDTNNVYMVCAYIYRASERDRQQERDERGKRAERETRETRESVLSELGAPT